MLKIYGRSDDLVEIEGHISDEFYCNEDYKIIGCSDGTVFKIIYDDMGIWRITLLNRGSAFQKLVTLPLNKNGQDDLCSDVIYLDDTVEFVLLSNRIARK